VAGCGHGVGTGAPSSSYGGLANPAVASYVNPFIPFRPNSSPPVPPLPGLPGVVPLPALPPLPPLPVRTALPPLPPSLLDYWSVAIAGPRCRE
jgi:hypothetical protein